MLSKITMATVLTIKDDKLKKLLLVMSTYVPHLYPVPNQVRTRCMIRREVTHRLAGRVPHVVLRDGQLALGVPAHASGEHREGHRALVVEHVLIGHNKVGRTR